MDNPRTRRQDDIKGQLFNYLYTFRQALPSLPNHRLVVLGLGLLNIILLISVIATGINCAKARQDSLHGSHAASAELLAGLSELRSNHSNVLEARDEAKSALDAVLQNHTQIKKEIDLLKAINDQYQKQKEVLENEKTILRANYTALTEACACPPKWIHYMFSCYLFSFSDNRDLRKNWDDSREDCISREADLVIIDTPEEQTFVSHHVETLVPGKAFWQNSFWLGIRDIEEEGTWVWINNVTEVEQRYWRDGEPNDHGHLGEDCGATFYSLQNPWKTRNDVSCRSTVLYWICEKTLK